MISFTYYGILCDIYTIYGSRSAVDIPLFTCAVVLLRLSPCCVGLRAQDQPRHSPDNDEATRGVADKTAKSPEQQRAEHYDRQLEAVIREPVTFTKRRVMNRGEYGLFLAAMSVTRQPMPTGHSRFLCFRR